MRPRLTESEVKFLLDMLCSQKDSVQTKIERIDELEHQVYAIRKEARRHDPSIVLRGGYSQKKEELQQLKSQYRSLYRHVYIYEGLVVRFQDLLAGKKRGRLKNKSESGRLFLSIEQESGSKK